MHSTVIAAALIQRDHYDQDQRASTKQAAEDQFYEEYGREPFLIRLVASLWDRLCLTLYTKSHRGFPSERAKSAHTKKAQLGNSCA